MPGLFRLALAALSAICLSARAGAAADAYQDASALYKQGDRAGALVLLDNQLAVHPHDARARFLKGVILSQEDRRREAIELFTALSEEFPELPEPYNNLAVLYAAQGDYEGARTALERAIHAYPGYATAYENLGDVYAALAGQAYERALQLDATDATSRTKLALIKELVPARSLAPTATVAQAAPVGAPSTPRQPELPQPSSPAASAPKPTPDRTAQPEPEPNAQEQTQAVLKMVEDWARAWASKDVESYLSFYATDFRPAGGAARAKWAATRRDRIAKPKRITVEVISPTVMFKDRNHATVVFQQNYRADSAKSSLRKTLQVVRQGERWLIQQESISK